MESDYLGDVYTLADIASAADSTEAEARAVAGSERLWSYADAVRIGKLLVTRRYAASAKHEAALFSEAGPAASVGAVGLPVVVSGSLHLGFLGVLFLLMGLAPTAARTTGADKPISVPSRLIFLATPGPGGGGGGGGRRQKAPAPKGVVPASAPAEPRPRPLAAEQLPMLVAPIVAAPADLHTRDGLLEQTAAREDSRGSGLGGGVGSGAGVGIGEGGGNGIGPGTGGGIGGGPYRPGSGINPPRLLREVKADYTEEARRRGLTGEVVLEIVVRSDGTVGDVKLLEGLGSGLNERAIQAVRQWRFSPADRLGIPVDVVVEVGVEFRLR